MALIEYTRADEAEFALLFNNVSFQNSIIKVDMYEHAHIPLSATVSASEPMSEPVSTAANLYKQYAQDAQAEGRSAAATHVAAPVSLTLCTR